MAAGMVDNVARTENKRKVGRAVFHILLLALIVAAAWTAGVQWLVPKPAPARPGLSQDSGRYRSSERSQRDVSQMIGLAPLGAADLELLPSDPGHIVPPAGANGRQAFQRVGADGSREQFGRYTWAGSVAAAQTYYTTALAARNMRLLGTTGGPDDWRTFVFTDGFSYVTVALKKNSTNEKIITIFLATKSPPGQAPGQASR